MGAKFDDYERTGALVSYSDDPANEAGWDFFVSYAAEDENWAEWISWHLESVGYRVLVQVWDSVPGAHWMTALENGLLRRTRMLALLSRSYLRSVYARSEWQAAYRDDPLGFQRRLIPVRIEDCEQKGLLGGVVSFDLFDLPVDKARELLLAKIAAAVGGRDKASVEPGFPKAPSSVEYVAQDILAPARRQQIAPHYPGPGSPTRRSVRRTRVAAAAALLMILVAVPFVAVYAIGSNSTPSTKVDLRPQTSSRATPGGPNTSTQPAASTRNNLVPTTPATSALRLNPAESFDASEVLISSNGRYHAMLETDGNFRVRDSGGVAQWETRASPGGRLLLMESNGNLVIYMADGTTPVWASNSSPAPGSHLELTDDGVLTIRDPNGTEIWSGTYTNTLRRGEQLRPGSSIKSPNGQYTLSMKADGNLTVTGPRGNLIWQSETSGYPGAYLELRQDGRLALSDASGTEISIRNRPFPNEKFNDAALEVQDDGNVVLGTTGHHPVWASGKK